MSSYTVLQRDLRRDLESTVRQARRTAEAGARKVIEQFAVHHHEPWPSMTPPQRELRNRLRAHGRQLGDRRDDRRGVQGIDRLTTECAYEHWHRMLFARFLAECELLIEPQSGVAISLAECEELARASARDWLELAADYAQGMLPQIFRSGDPVLEVALPPETRSELEDLMKALPREVFLADDSLGWVYQYWQADRKEEVNRSGTKIGADELPAVTQLFTEDYMVFFLLHNTLGAWWAGKVLAANPLLAESATNEDELRAACQVGDVEWTYLRFVREEGKPWRPAAGTFEGWPKAARDITLLDPCMGSGHFLVFALPMLAAMRASEEQLSAEAAIEAVLRDNLFGLEIDPRCTQIAAFNLALAAWRRIGHRLLPPLLGVSKAEWLKLAERAAQALPVPPKTDLLGTEDNLFSDAMKRGFERLYELFSKAPILGSLIQPRARGDLVEAGIGDFEPLFAKVVSQADTFELSEMAVAAQGLTKAAEILRQRFTVVATNVPFLGREKQDPALREIGERLFDVAKADLATMMILRCIEFCGQKGSVAVVSPQYWLFLTRYGEFRKRLLSAQHFHAVARLGPGAFEAITGEVVNTALVILEPSANDGARFSMFDVARARGAAGKAADLQAIAPTLFSQVGQLANPDSIIGYESEPKTVSLDRFAYCFQGLATSDNAQFVQCFWEQPALDRGWDPFQMAPESTAPVGGCSWTIHWEDGNGRYYRHTRALKDAGRLGGWKSGHEAWGRPGIAINRMGDLPVAAYLGTKFDCNVAVLVPTEKLDIDWIWAFTSSDEYQSEVRRLNQKASVTNLTLAKVPVDKNRWQDEVQVELGRFLETRDPNASPVTAGHVKRAPASPTARRSAPMDWKSTPTATVSSR